MSKNLYIIKFWVLIVFMLLHYLSLQAQSDEEIFDKWLGAKEKYRSFILERDSLLAFVAPSDSIKSKIIIEEFQTKIDSVNYVEEAYYTKVDSINKLFDVVIKEARRDGYNRNYKEALKKYHEILESKPKNAEWIGEWVRVYDIYEYMASSHAQLNQADSSLYYLGKAIDAGLDEFIVFVDFNYYNMFQLPEWNELSRKMDNYFIKNNPNVNFEIAFTLRHLYKKDQYIRNIFAHFQLPEEVRDSLTLVWNTIDSLNAGILTYILDEHGYPGKELVGEENSLIAYQLIIHSPLELGRKYLPLVVEYLSEPEREIMVNFLIDRVLINEGRKQLYGTQYIRGENGKPVLAPMEDNENINKVRKELGLKVK